MMDLLALAKRLIGPMALATVWTLFVPIAAAQSTDDPQAYYFPRSRFSIPCDLRPGDSRVAKIALYVSDDEGESWRLHDTGGPNTRRFDFEAYHDGWYWFISQTIDVQGRRFPDKLTRDDVGLRVYVDTVRPAVGMKQETARKGEIGVEWQLRDATLDLATLTLEYRPSGGAWKKALVERSARGRASWDPRSNDDVEVRLEVKDRAGNLGGATTIIRQAGGSASRKDPGFTPEEPEIRKVNAKTFQLNCQLADVGDSGVSEVEIWLTKDDGRTWKLYKAHKFKTNYEHKTVNKPHEIEVEEEGLYGLTLIAKSGVGLGEKPPRPGDRPQLSVEVDTTKPATRIDNVIVGRGADTGKVIITWTVDDKNLTPAPISISYRAKDAVDWITVPGARRIENAGRFVWQVDSKVPFEFHLRVEALDEASNLGSDETKSTVKVDLAKPRVRVLNVETSNPLLPH